MLNIKKGDILKYQDIYDIKGAYICLYEAGIKGVSNSGWYPKGFWMMILDGELENYNPLEQLIADNKGKGKPIIVLKWIRNSKDLSFIVDKIIR